MVCTSTIVPPNPTAMPSTWPASRIRNSRVRLPLLASCVGVLALAASRAAYAYLPSHSFFFSSSSSSLVASFSSSPRIKRRHPAALQMRMKPSGEERERGLAEKDLREKHSQVLLSQRIQHIRRLRASRREDVMATEWYCPTKPNPDWRYAAEGERPRGEGREAAAMEELTAMLDYHAERGAGGSVVNVYAKEEEAAEAFAQKLGGSLAAFDRVTQASGVPGGVPPPVPLSSVASTPAVVGRALKRHDYAPLAVWRCLRRWAGNAEGEPCTYNGIRGTGKYVVILVDPNLAATTLVEGLNRMRIIPSSLAAVVGVTPLSCPELARLAKKAGLTATGASTSTYLLSDTSYSWMDAHGLPRLSLRPWLLILDGSTGMVLSVKRDPTPGTLNDAVMEVVGDWRGKR